MSKQSAATELSADVFEHGTPAGGETGSAARVAATHTITIRKSGPSISSSSKPIVDNDVVIWEAKDFAANETLVIRPAHDAALFDLSYPDAPDKRKVKGIIGDKKAGDGIEVLSVAYSVILKKSGVETILFDVESFTDSEDEPNLVIDKLGDPPHPVHPPHHRS